MTFSLSVQCFNLRSSFLVLVLVGTGLGLTFDVTLNIRAVGLIASQVGSRPETDETCFATLDDGATVLSSTDASAVQLSIDAATPGQIVKAAGYCPGAHIVLTKSLALQGGYTTTDWLQTFPITQPTTLDGQSSGRVLWVAGDIMVSLDGLTIISGSVYGDGGSIYSAVLAMTLAHSRIIANHAGDNFNLCINGYNGGGVYNAGQLMVIASQFASNFAGSGGADLGCAGDGGDGGGIYSAGTLTVFDSNFNGNQTGIGGFAGTHNPWGDNGSGGGIFSSGTLTISGSTFQHNRIGWGIIGGKGGGIASTGSARIINTVVSDNFAVEDGDGLYLAAEAILIHATIANNSSNISNGIGLYTEGPALLTNTIIVSQSIGVLVGATGSALLDGVLWDGNEADVAGSSAITVTHAYTGSPAFHNPDADDYHLTASSAAINRGVASPVKLDLDGNLRDALPDLGAYEYQFSWKFYLPIVTH